MVDKDNIYNRVDALPNPGFENLSPLWSYRLEHRTIISPISLYIPRCFQGFHNKPIMAAVFNISFRISVALIGQEWCSTGSLVLRVNSLMSVHTSSLFPKSRAAERHSGRHWTGLFRDRIHCSSGNSAIELLAKAIQQPSFWIRCDKLSSVFSCSSCEEVV